MFTEFFLIVQQCISLLGTGLLDMVYSVLLFSLSLTAIVFVIHKIIKT